MRKLLPLTTTSSSARPVCRQSAGSHREAGAAGELLVPVIDRNPQTVVPNIFLAQASDFRAATQRVFRSGSQASYIALPTVTA